MPPLCPASTQVAPSVRVSYSAATPEYAPAASRPSAEGLYARHDTMPAQRPLQQH